MNHKMLPVVGFAAGSLFFTTKKCIMAKSKAASATKKAAVKGKTTVIAAATKRAASNGSGSTTSPLEKFFTDQLKDIYYAEQQMLKALAQMEEASTSEELKEAFSDHRHQTQKHVKRLEKVFEKLRKPAEGKQCEAMDGLISEAQTIINETPEGSMTRDAALIVAAQKVEHYEIATYGGLVQLALTMGMPEVSDLLDTTLMEEEQSDLLLTDIAETHINMDAEKEGSQFSWADAAAGEAMEEV